MGQPSKAAEGAGCHSPGRRITHRDHQATRSVQLETQPRCRPESSLAGEIAKEKMLGRDPGCSSVVRHAQWTHNSTKTKTQAKTTIVRNAPSNLSTARLKMKPQAHRHTHRTNHTNKCMLKMCADFIPTLRRQREAGGAL